MEKKNPFYKKKWFVVVCVIFGLGIIGSIFADEELDDPEQEYVSPVAVYYDDEAQDDEIVATITPTATPEPSPMPTPPPEDEILIVDYINMFHNFDADIYVGRWVQITGRAYHRRFMLPLYFSYGLDGGWISMTDDEDTIRDMFEPGDYVTVIGYIENSPIITRTVHIKYATARLATEYEITQIGVFAQIREDARAAAEREFRDSARTISYDNLIRYPSRYEGEIIRITVRITQIFDRGGIFGALFERGFAGTQDGNEWVVAYDLPEDARRILVDDTVTFYGIYNGVTERQRAIGGARVHIPHMTARYHR